MTDGIDEELTKQNKEPHTINGVSSEVGHANGILSPKQAFFLNSLFWDAVEARPFRLFIKSYRSAKVAVFQQNSEIKIWLGRQLGEVIIRPSYNERTGKLELTAKKKAINEIMKYFFTSEALANKYLNLNEEGFFDRFKNESLTEYWLWRADINLKNYKQILEENGNG